MQECGAHHRFACAASSAELRASMRAAAMRTFVPFLPGGSVRRKPEWMVRRYAIVVVKEGAEHWAFVPDVPGVYGRGVTSDEALSDAADTLVDFIAMLDERGEPVPEPAAASAEVRYADIPA